MFVAMILATSVFADTINDKEGVAESDAINTTVANHEAKATDDNADDDDSDVPPSALTKDAIGDMLLQSVSLMGIPYRWGGNTPETGMDCSGFIRYVFKKSLGITLPRTANEMSKLGKRVSINQLQPGDLLFFNIHHMNSHVGMYIGDNKFIQSPHTGDQIKISEFNDYWRSHLNGAKRIVAEDQDDSGNTTIEDYQDIDDEALPSGRSGAWSHRRGSRHNHHRHGHSSGHSKANNVDDHSQTSATSSKTKVKGKVSPHHKHKRRYKKSHSSN